MRGRCRRQRATRARRRVLGAASCSSTTDARSTTSITSPNRRPLLRQAIEPGSRWPRGARRRSRGDSGRRSLARDMLHPDGYICFQRRRHWTNSVPFVRWTTAPSFRALAGLAARARGRRRVPGTMRIWIDLANSPHVPLFEPVVARLGGGARGRPDRARPRPDGRAGPLEWPDVVVVGGESPAGRAAKGRRDPRRARRRCGGSPGARPDVAFSHGSYAQIVAAAARGSRR